MNRYVGSVIDIVYENPLGSNISGVLPLYVVVYFPECTLNPSFINGYHITYITVPVVTDRYEKKYCSITTIPLRLCNDITVYKSQGITVAGKVWEKALICLATDHQRKTMGTELVGISTATDSHIIVIGNSLYSIDRMSLPKLVHGKVCAQ